MNLLQCKTDGNGSVNYKRRIYFTCHPMDHRRYFKKVTDEILKCCDCAIYYYEPGQAAKDEERFLQLRQMWLFVIPVTVRLLNTPNWAMDEDYRYAVEHNIRVLPLIMEPDLSDLYGARFGDREYLSKYDLDPAALPYEQKLKNFLNFSLYNSLWTRNIQNTFSARIFISYRKMDRRYIRDLAALLHKDPRCWDIGIWFDELLIPGEDFNTTIRTELEQCDLFVISMTPNVVKEDNYILSDEYPMAQALNKPRAAVMMEPTDLQGTQTQEDTDLYICDNMDWEALAEWMLQNLPDKKNDHSPEHKLDVGSAYMKGFMVEVNPVRGLQLITEAAEEGLPDAIRELCNLYEYGEGVSCDFGKVIYWRRKLVEQKRVKYEQTLARIGNGPSIYCPLSDYVLEMDLLARMLYKNEEYIEAAEVFKCATELAQAWADDHDLHLYTFHSDGQRKVAVGYDPLVYQLATGYEMRGMICKKAGDLKNARQWYLRAVPYAEMMAEGKAEKAYRVLARIYYELGELEMLQSKDAAATWYEKALTYYEMLAQTGDRVMMFFQAECYGKLGEITGRIPLLRRSIHIAGKMIWRRLTGWVIGLFKKHEKRNNHG